MAIAAVATTVVGTNSNDDMSLLIKNVEALADGEDSDCPNGCKQPHDHCWCNGYQPYTEAN